jgi:hypothetical protein
VKSRIQVFFVLAMATLFAANLSAQETVVVAGAGPSTFVVQEFFDLFSSQPAAEGYTFVVPERSIKHAGGLKATADHIFGRTGRPITDAERGDTLREIPLVRIPITFVIDPAAGVEELDLGQLGDLLTGKVTNWSQVGGADLTVRLVGREPTESALMEIAKVVPAINEADFDLVLKKDHQLVELMGTEDRRGVLGFGAAPNFDPALTIPVTGFEAGLSVGLVHDRSHDRHPLVVAVREFSGDPVWLEKVVELNYLPAVTLP